MGAHFSILRKHQKMARSIVPGEKGTCPRGYRVGIIQLDAGPWKLVHLQSVENYSGGGLRNSSMPIAQLVQGLGLRS